MYPGGSLVNFFPHELLHFSFKYIHNCEQVREKGKMFVGDRLRVGKLQNAE